MNSFCSRIGVAAVLLVIASIPAMSSDIKERSRLPFGSWILYYDVDNEDSRGACNLEGKWGDGAYISFFALYKSQYFIAISDPRWEIPTGAGGNLNLFFDARAPIPVAMGRLGATTIASKIFYISSPEGRQILDLFAASTRLAFVLPKGQRFNADMNSTAAAAREFEKCVLTWAGETIGPGETPQARKTEPAKSAAPPKEARNAPAPQKAPAAPSQSFGTGFVINRSGYLLTNNHVVGNCRSVKVHKAGYADQEAALVAHSVPDDLAVVKVSHPYPEAARFQTQRLRLGAAAATFGYPLAGALASNGNFTIGSITGLSGLADDGRFAQISTPVQPGNSGGPLLAQNGTVMGVVSSKMDAIAVAKFTGDIPQNVNFAIKSNIATNFLDANSIEYETSPGGPSLTDEDLAAYGQHIAAQIICN